MKHKTTYGIASLCLLLAFLLPLPVWAQTLPERPAAWAQPVLLEHTENFYKVTDELYRAAQPTAAAMQSYENFGIRTVINLRGFHSDGDEIAGTKLMLIEMPTHAWSVDNDDYVIMVLQAIRKAEKPVLLHCHHGADRTGLIVAMYRIAEQGWTKADALDEMRNGGFGFHTIWQNIPDYIKNANINKIKNALSLQQ